MRIFYDTELKMIHNLAKCPKCGWVHVAITFASLEQSGEVSADDRQRLQRCFQCRAPSSTFVAAGPNDASTGSTLQCVVLPEDHAIWPQFFEDLARVCMCAKCIEADADFLSEVTALVLDLTPAECQRAIEIVREDRATPNELKACIEGHRLEARYDYLLDILTARSRP